MTPLSRIHAVITLLLFLQAAGCDSTVTPPFDPGARVPRTVMVPTLPPTSGEIALVTDPQRKSPDTQITAQSLTESGTYKMTVVESDDPLVDIGETHQGPVEIWGKYRAPGIYHGYIDFQQIEPSYLYRNALKFTLSAEQITVEMLAVAVTYVHNVHPCGDQWEEVYKTQIEGGGPVSGFTLRIMIERKVVHTRHVTGCAAPPEQKHTHTLSVAIYP